MEFSAELEQAPGKAATGITVPEDVLAALGAGRRPAVAVTINGHTFRTTIGSVGGAVSSTVTASIVVHQGWSKALDTAAWITVVSAIWFSAVNAERAIDERSD